MTIEVSNQLSQAKSHTHSTSANPSEVSFSSGGFSCYVVGFKHRPTSLLSSFVKLGLWCHKKTAYSTHVGIVTVCYGEKHLWEMTTGGVCHSTEWDNDRVAWVLWVPCNTNDVLTRIETVIRTRVKNDVWQWIRLLLCQQCYNCVWFVQTVLELSTMCLLSPDELRDLLKLDFYP